MGSKKSFEVVTSKEMEIVREVPTSIKGVASISRANCRVLVPSEWEGKVVECKLSDEQPEEEGE